MLGDLRLQRALEQPPRQLAQQPLRAGDLQRALAVAEQLVDQLIRELRPLQQPAARQPRQRRSRGNLGLAGNSQIIPIETTLDHIININLPA
jgi:hypothetical protein